MYACLSCLYTHVYMHNICVIAMHVRPDKNVLMSY